MSLAPAHRPHGFHSPIHRTCHPERQRRISVGGKSPAVEILRSAQDDRRRSAAGHLLTVAALLLAGFLTGCINEKEEVATYRKVLDGPQRPPAQDYSRGQPLTLESA